MKSKAAIETALRISAARKTLKLIDAELLKLLTSAEPLHWGHAGSAGKADADLKALLSFLNGTN